MMRGHEAPGAGTARRRDLPWSHTRVTVLSTPRRTSATQPSKGTCAALQRSERGHSVKQP